jgi:hypothetical protein
MKQAIGLSMATVRDFGKRKMWMSVDTCMDKFERRLAGLVVLSFLVVVALLARPMLVGGIYTHDDLGWLQFPIRYLYAQALTSGEDLLWTPQLSNGMYLHGEGQVGMYHPLHWILYRTLPLEWAFNLEFILSYVWMFPGMYLMLGRFGLPAYASLFGALVFTFSGFNLLHSVHLNAIAVISHIPWLIVAIDIVLRTMDRRKLAAAQLSISLLTGSELLLGQPQYVWFSALAEGLFIVWRLKGSVTWWRIPMLVLAKLVGVMLGAVQLLPTLDVLARSMRIDPSVDFVLRFSLHPINLVQLWSPFALEGRTLDKFKQEAVLYNGAFCTLALLWLFVRRHRLGRWRSLVVVMSAFSAMMLIVALGKYGGVYQWIAALPLVGLLRGPSRYIILVHLAMAVLAAVAFTDLAGLVRRRERVPWRALWPFAALASASIATTVAAAWASSQLAEHSWVKHLAPVQHSIIGLALILLATVLLLAAARGVRWSLYAIVVLMVIDITAWGVFWLWQVPPRSLAAVADTHTEPPTRGVGRVYSPWNSANSLTMKGYRLSHAYTTFLPVRELAPQGLPAQRLAGVQWALNTEGLQGNLPYGYPQGHGSWVEVPEPMPRVRMVTHALVSHSVATDIERINIADTALLDQPVELGQGEVGTASVVTDRPGYIEIVTSSSSRQLLLLSESYHPGWRATEDGRPIEIMRAYGDFQACVVGPGQRRIVFRFQPASFATGAWVSSLGICCALVAYVLVRRLSCPADGHRVKQAA